MRSRFMRLALLLICACSFNQYVYGQSQDDSSILSTSTIASPSTTPTTCDDKNACTFDYLSSTASSADLICKHESVPPSCQPLLLHSASEPWSSLNAHRAVLGPDYTPSSSLLLDEHLDIHLLVNIAGDPEVIKNRVWTFVENMHKENFPHAIEKDLPAPAPRPFYSLSIYNETHTHLVHALDNCYECLERSLTTALLPAIRAMRVPPPAQQQQTNSKSDHKKPVPTPAGIYNAMRSSLEMAKNSSFATGNAWSTPVYRPYAHQHTIVLDGVGYLFSQSPDIHLRKVPFPTAEQISATNEALASLLQALSTTPTSNSYSVWYESEIDGYLNASIGSPRHTVFYRDDSSHYNPALTLRSLIKDKGFAVEGDKHMPGQDASWMAQMLSRQIVARTYEVSRLEVKFNGQLRHVWETHYRQPKSVKKWCSSCDRYRCDPVSGWTHSKITCENPGEMCSLLHGCTKLLPKGTIKKQKDSLNVTQVAGVNISSIDTTAPDENGEIEVDIAVDPTLAGGVMDATHFGTTTTTTQSSTSEPPIIIDGAPFPLFRTKLYQSGTRRKTRDLLFHPPVGKAQRVPVKQWSPTLEFTKPLIAGGRATILKNTVVSNWEALRKWNATYLRDCFANEANLNLTRTKISSASRKFFDPDDRTPLSLPSLINLTMTYEEATLTPADFFEAITKNYTLPFGNGPQPPTSVAPEVPAIDAQFDDMDENELLYYYFGSYPKSPSLISDILPYANLFDSDSDLSKNKMFLWFSSSNVNMHTHFDQDHNFFVQLAGVKRFTIVQPEQFQSMHLFPRIHPLWHKSQVDYNAPDLELFPQYQRVNIQIAEVHPGDVLYIPPYTWHQVETVTPSISLSVWSHDTQTLSLMESVYRHDHKIDLLAHTQGRIYALRLYVDLMIYELYGNNATTKFTQQLIMERYRSITDFFHEEEGDDEGASQQQAPLCPPDKIPTAQHVYGDAMLDKNFMSSHFDLLSVPSTRDILFSEYIEELTAAVVGPTRVMRFFMECFQGQTYQVTAADSVLHRTLWRHVAAAEQ